ncbi:putative membrane-anchored protein [Brevundimonas alba]|uniref:Putative membrane-anchored protein n=1 Tax=Brevundimonas alba TaxID=74314 RepID=A0A7X6BMK7_9CAUL|nr:DUF2167 domain-containing protein [Brevundimonas alba]NJC40462.1 putative membrane-anchored protein [Brevundimonas alba]
MIRKLFAALLLALGLFTTGAATAAPQTLTPEQQTEVRRLEALQDSLKPQTGTVAIPAAEATLALGDAYYFLNAEDAARVLTEGWGNPPSSVQGVLGMVFPKDKAFYDDTWGAVITYVGDGYVSDEDASKINYSELLTQLRQGEEEDNRARTADGYPAINLVGWAQQPSYDGQKHNLIWAKELAFSDAPDHTLNYDVRVLGRAGVLSMNIVDDMADLADVGAAATQLMNTASFNEGARYADYREGVDKKATYGVAGLIAGGAAVALAKKAGLLGILFLVLKKGGVFLLVGAGAAWAWLRRQFGGKAGGDFSSPRAAAQPEADPVADEISPPTADEAMDERPETDKGL